jgi:hypothetical protein
MNSCNACLSEKENIKLVKGLYGSEFEKNRACAFCSHHRCYLTVKQVKQHNCLGKQCWYLRKNEQHDWWRQREVVRQRRKARKERGGLHAI